MPGVSPGGLGDFEKKMIKSFELPLSAMSRGQRIKAALLSALAYRPQLVVLDEPLSGLDPLGGMSFSPACWSSRMRKDGRC